MCQEQTHKMMDREKNESTPVTDETWTSWCRRWKKPQKEKQRVIQRTKKKRPRRGDRNQDVAGGEEENDENKGRDGGD